MVEEGATIADYLLTMVIRALDYAPPVNLEFCDFLSAVLTSDREINPNDSKYKFRETLLKEFSQLRHQAEVCGHCKRSWNLAGP